MRLTAFEFVSVTNGPQLVRVLCKGDVIFQFNVVGWLGVDLPMLNLMIEDGQDLTIEGHGLGRFYWGDDLPAWATAFDAHVEGKRIDALRAAAQREANSNRLVVQ
jgi:hypothetical protein